jgi:hypothetical protein
MGRKLKFDEKTRVLTIRVPESRYDEIKGKIADILTPINNNPFIAMAQANTSQMEHIIKNGTKKKIQATIRKIEKIRVSQICGVSYIIREIHNAKIWKFKKFDVKRIDFNNEKELMKRFSIKQILESGYKAEEFLLKQRELHANHSIYEKLSSVVNYYNFRLGDIRFLMTRINKENLDTCPFCYGGEDEEKLDFDKMDKNIEKTKRYYEKAKENRDKYQRHVNFTITNLDRLQKHIKRIEGFTNDIKRLKKALAL